MKISVVVPAYNYARFLPDLFQSLVLQTYSDWECFIIDNGSTDETGKVCVQICETDSRFIYLRTNPCNPSAARNIGLKSATGNFIQFLDADDIIDRQKFEIQLKLFSQDVRTDIVYGDYLLTDGELSNHKIHQKKLHLSEYPFNDFINRWEKDLTIPIHSYLIRRKCFVDWGYMDESIRTHEDWELQLNFSLKGAKYKYHDHVVAYYRIHQASSSRNDRTVNRRDTLDVLMKYFSDNKISRQQKFIIVKRYAEFTGDILIDKLRLNNVKILDALSFKQRPILNSMSLLLFPVYLIDKILKKILGR